MRTFYAPKGTNQVGKFGAIPPTDPDDISQSTPDFFSQFSTFRHYKWLGVDPSPVRCALASVGHPLAPVIFYKSYFLPVVDQSSGNSVGP